MNVFTYLAVGTVLSSSLLVTADPIIDGVISDNEKEDAKQYSNFLITKPLTYSKPLMGSQTYTKTDERGIYIAFTNQSQSSLAAQKTTLRDEDIRADYNEVVIDFDGGGGRAFGFKVGRANSIQDSVWSSDSREQVDWDGAWQHAVSEIDAGWISEFYIPWSIAARVDNRGTIDKVKLYFSRWDNTRQQRISFPAIDRNNQRFLDNFHNIFVERNSKGALDLFPYFRANYSTVERETNYKSGIDIFWKPSTNQQLNVSINPDFGQVESDELVVNFSAIETFFTEKRPFFSENHDLFDLQGPETLRLVHTPRVGGEPSNSEEVASEIDIAAKYVSLGKSWDYGVLVSQEANEKKFDGRSFGAARVQYKLDAGKVGALQTVVEDNTAGRKAYVTAFDFEHDLNKEISLSGQFMHSRIEKHDDRFNISDSAYWVSAQYTPIDVWHHEFTFFQYGEKFNIDDFGFVKRVNREQFEYETEYEWADFEEIFLLREVKAGFELEYKTNEQNHKLPLQIGFSVEALTQSNSGYEFKAELLGAGKDDFLTRGNNPVDLPSAVNFGFEYHSPEDSIFQYGLVVEVGTEGFDGQFAAIEIIPSFQVGENINIGFEISYEESESWLLWENSNDIGEYQKEEFTIAINAAMLFMKTHELRLKLESVALKADYKNSYLVNANGNVNLAAENESDFSLGEFAVQLRYRYAIGLLSDIYVVYSRGGEIEEDSNELSHINLLRDSNDQKDIESLLVKVKFHF